MNMCMYFLQIGDILDIYNIYMFPLYHAYIMSIFLCNKAFFKNMIFNGYLIFQSHYINLTKSMVCLSLPTDASQPV